MFRYLRMQNRGHSLVYNLLNRVYCHGTVTPKKVHEELFDLRDVHIILYYVETHDAMK